MTIQPSTPESQAGRRRKRHEHARSGGTCGPPPADTPAWVSPFVEAPAGSGLFAATMLEAPPGSGLFVHHLVEDPVGSGLHLMEGVSS